MKKTHPHFIHQRKHPLGGQRFHLIVTVLAVFILVMLVLLMLFFFFPNKAI